MTQWQDISTAPKDGTLVDLWTKSTKGQDSRRFVEACWHEDEEDWFSKVEDNFLRDCGRYATHFMPLPPPPTEGKE